MQKLIFLFSSFLFSCFLFSSNSTAENYWTGTIIDAHSQYGCKTDGEDIIYAIKTFGVNKTLLSARGGCNWNETPTESQLRVLNLVKDLGEKGEFLISSKLGGLGHPGIENEVSGLQWLAIAEKIFNKDAVGYGEIIVQHADHFHEELIRNGLQSNLKSSRINKAISIILNRNKPIILHLELNDSEENSVKILSQLRYILRKYPKQNFVLIHMAQSTVVEARELIEQFENIYFLTSHANVLNSIGKIKRQRIGEVTQVGWINLFTRLQENAPYKGWFKEYLSGMDWKRKWKELFEQYPERFVFAMDNVFIKHWRAKRYKRLMKIWRKAFSQLSKDTAMKVACENANRLWSLNFTCLTR